MEFHLGITSIADLETATMEPNGQLGYVLKRHARPVTIGDLEALLKQGTWPTESKELFQEVIQDVYSRPIDSKIQ